jgi:hypothetical protein
LSKSPIARRLARAGRGELQATDPPGRGRARLELRLPLVTPSMPGDPDEEPRIASRQQLRSRDWYQRGWCVNVRRRS